MGELTRKPTQKRELGLRVVTSLILLSIFSTIYVMLPRSVLWLVFAVIWMIALSEWLTMASVSRRHQRVACMGWGMVALWIACVPEQTWIWVSLGCLFWMVAAAVLVFGPWKSWFTAIMRNRWLSTMLSMTILWVAYAGLVAFGQTSHALLLVLIIVWLSDSLAYLVGRRWGRHKLAPIISPGKSWEGFLGGFIGVIVCVMVGSLFVNDDLLSWHYWFISGFLSTVCVLGDCFESAFKRVSGVKDSAQILPGHGGVLDRVDGLIAVLPFGALFKLFSWI